jgi:hypothetical protein
MGYLCVTCGAAHRRFERLAITTTGALALVVLAWVLMAGFVGETASAAGAAAGPLAPLQSEPARAGLWRKAAAEVHAERPVREAFAVLRRRTRWGRVRDHP